MTKMKNIQMLHFYRKLVTGVMAVLLMPVVLVLGVASSTVSAEFKCGGVTTAIDYGCKNVDGGTGDVGIYSVLIALLNFAVIGVGLAVTIGVVIGGLMFVTARGNSDQTKKGIDVIRNALIGLLLFIFMYAIINFLVPGGLFR